MNLLDFGKTIIKAGAPILGTAIGGPGGAIIASLIANAFGSDEKDLDSLAKTIQADPEAAMKLTAIQYQHEEAIYSLQNQDISNARQRQIDLTKAIGKSDWIVSILAILVTVGFFGCLLSVFTLRLDPSGHDVLNVLCGVLGTGWVQIISYYFGSSHGAASQYKILKP